jgi:flagellar motility protein MotE (MotC chaperone)
MEEEKNINEVAPGESAGKKLQLGSLKKYLLPTLIALVLFILSTAVSSLFLQKPSVMTSLEGTPSDTTNLTADSISEKLSSDDSGPLDIDTAAIMRELAFLDYNPEKKADSSPSAVRDSSDTLNWIQKEMAKLEEEKASVENKKKELQTLDARVNQGLEKLQQAESTRLVSLARLYDGMRPEEVAKLFENLDDSMVVAILPRMKAANAAKLLALLPPKRAALISTQLISVVEK